MQEMLKSSKGGERYAKKRAKTIHWALPGAAGHKDNLGWGPGDRGEQNPPGAGYQTCRMLWGNSSLGSRVGLSTCFASERIFTCPGYLFFRASRLCPSAPPAPARPRHTNRPSGRCGPHPAGAAPASAPLTGVAFCRQIVPHVATRRPRRCRLRVG